jgi:nanoRNase/pAp phosphatase (c-di-AMP/oligoRNAs hydrolase)
MEPIGAIIDGKGGGHANAAGANGKRNLDKALAKSLAIIRGAIEDKTRDGAE